MSLIEMSLNGAVLVLIIVMLRAVLINKLPKETFVILWCIVLLRLLVPLSIPYAWSAYSLLNGLDRDAAVGKADFESGQAYVPAAGEQTAGLSVRNAAALSDAGILQTRNANGIVGNTAVSTADHMRTASVWGPLWGIGTALCAMFFAAAYVRCRREFCTALPAASPFVEQWIKEHPRGFGRLAGQNRPVLVRQSDRIASPLTYGIVRPVILLPKRTDWEKERELSYILLHEYAHIRRYDAAKKLIATAAVCIHWFNPLVWVLYVLFNRDIELACDEYVVRRCGEDAKQSYARTLIRMEEKKSGLMPLCNNFSKTAIEERIGAIMKMKKRSLGTIFLAGALIIGVTGAFATSAAEKRAPHAAPAGTAFSQEEFEKLSALQFDSYEDMTVAEYQEKVWALTDTREYRALLERFSADGTLYGMRDTDETAAFLFYTLDPLTGERWRSQDFSGCAVSDTETGAGDAVLEYVITLTIRNPEALTVREYNNARTGFEEGVEAFVRDNPPELLTEEASARELNRLARKQEGDALELSFEYCLQLPDFESRLWAEEEALRQQVQAERDVQWAEVLAPYLPFGVTYRYAPETDDYKLYWQGKEVRGIVDERTGTWIAEHAGIGTYGEGAVELYAVYDGEGRLTGLREATQEEEAQWAALRRENTESILAAAQDRKNAYGSEEDYSSLLRLKTADYRKTPLTDFNMLLLDWCNEDYERMERIGEDTASRGYQVQLSDAERAFVELTVQLSGEENGRYVQSNYTGRPKEDPSYAEQLPERLVANDRRGPAWCDLYYRFSYHIADEEAVTVGERDDCIGGMIFAVRAFWEETDIEVLLAMTEADITAHLQAIASAYGNDRIVIAIDADGIGYECMDERSIR